MTAPGATPTAVPPAPRFLDRLRTALLIRSYPPEVVEVHGGWVRSFLQFHGLRHPETLGEPELGAFLTHLAVERRVPLAQQAQARQARLFLYRAFRHREVGPLPVQYVAPAGAPGPAPKTLLEQVREVLRLRHYADTTTEASVNWVRRFILFPDKRHPLEMREEEITAFLTYLAVEFEVAASTQNQAFHALLFLDQQVLPVELDRLDASRASGAGGWSAPRFRERRGTVPGRRGGRGAPAGVTAPAGTRRWPGVAAAARPAVPATTPAALRRPTAL